MEYFTMGRKNKKAKQAMPSSSEILPCIDTQNNTAFELESEEDTRPEFLPYTGRSYYLLAGAEAARYAVPHIYLAKFPDLLSQAAKYHLRAYPYSPDPDPDPDHTIRLPDLDKDIAHTLVHFLYTGEYQTLRRPNVRNSEKASLEYRRAVLVYQMAVSYGLHSLVLHAKANITKFGKSVSAFNALDIWREVYEKLSKDDAWLYSHLKAKLGEAFDADGSVFAREQFLEHAQGPLGGTLMKIVVDIYNNKLSSARMKDGQAGRSRVAGCPKPNGNTKLGPEAQLGRHSS
ncbi:uncharacterized protein CIMG_02745 [Coccidioides immitis RS]|uniref:BTB domain-containing protein n=1 Tax=Coccidioides immitis (strain RS) TaxID=246410 RepID=J3KM10_COCIM|nr:uncharacterized protein CIMG_02745 [Coccidioides immitis RS]EAS37391.3 hypothetical protein CIMG_02745 [Coccidioides immitis RS]